LTAKLIDQRHLLPFGMAEDVRAKLARVTVVNAKDLFPADNGTDEQVVNRALHRVSRLTVHENSQNAMPESARRFTVKGLP
jgi:hypothetical protein